MTDPKAGPIAGEPLRFGKNWPNLVLIRDSGQSKAEFRVQLEVELSPDEAEKVEQLIWHGRSPQNLKKARELVLGRIPTGSTAQFRQIVADAFNAQPELMKPKPTK